MNRRVQTKHCALAAEKAQRLKFNSSLIRLMSEGSVPKLVVDEKVEVAVSLVGILAVCAATYHVSKTGDWRPLSAAAVGLSLVVLFVTSEQ